jgi:hypothetical protein
MRASRPRSLLVGNHLFVIDGDITDAGGAVATSPDEAAPGAARGHDAMNEGNQAEQGQNGKKGQASIPGQEGAEVGRRAHPGAPGEGPPSGGPAKRAQPEQPGSELEETLADKLLGDPPEP